MYAVDPLGLNKVATNPWLPGSTADPLVALAWILLFGGPGRGRRAGREAVPRTRRRRPPSSVRIGQGVAAGVLANGTAAMAVTTLGTGTTVLMLKSPWLLHWLNHGRHLTAFATYRYELHTTNHTGAYVLMLMFFPVIGLITSYLAAAIANPAPLDARPSGPGLPSDLWRVSRVTSRPEFSAQTLSVLAALCDQPSQWQHGYALAKQTGLKSGTLYPILIRLADRGLVEACWQDEPAPGRPRRHLYRLTAAGLASATGALASAAERAAEQAAAARAGAGKPRAGVRPGPAAPGAVAGMTP